MPSPKPSKASIFGGDNAHLDDNISVVTILDAIGFGQYAEVFENREVRNAIVVGVANNVQGFFSLPTDWRRPSALDEPPRLGNDAGNRTSECGLVVTSIADPVVFYIRLLYCLSCRILCTESHATRRAFCREYIVSIKLTHSSE